MLEKSDVTDYATRVSFECVATHELMICPSSRSIMGFGNVIFTNVYRLLLFIAIKVLFSTKSIKRAKSYCVSPVSLRDR